jgi:hypothetical protein
MKGLRLCGIPAQRPALANGLITDETVTSRALLWNFHEPLSAGENWHGTIELPVPGLLVEDGHVRVVTAMLSAGAGSLYETWEALGGPVSLTRLESEAMAAAAQPRHHIHRLSVNNGVARLPFSLKRDEVLFAELCPPRAGTALEASQSDLALTALDQALQYPGSVTGLT